MYIYIYNIAILYIYMILFVYTYAKQKQPGCKNVRGQSEAALYVAITKKIF